MDILYPFKFLIIESPAIIIQEALFGSVFVFMNSGFLMACALDLSQRAEFRIICLVLFSLCTIHITVIAVTLNFNCIVANLHFIIVIR